MRKLKAQSMEKVSHSRFQAYPGTTRYELGKTLTESTDHCHTPQFTEREWSLLSAGATKVTFEKGTVILPKGAPYAYMAKLECGRIVLEGEVRKKREIVDTIEEGDFFFVPALLCDPEFKTSTWYIAETQCVVHKINVLSALSMYEVCRWPVTHFHPC